MQQQSPSTEPDRCTFRRDTTAPFTGSRQTGRCPPMRRGWALQLASLSGKRGIVKITSQGKASLEVSGQGLVGLAFAPGRAAVLATTNAVHHLSWNLQGLPLVAEQPV